MKRRDFLKVMGAAALANNMFTKQVLSEQKTQIPAFSLNYILASSMYGNLPLEVILPQVRKTGADYIDIWPLKHGNQREQMEQMGYESFEKILKEYQVKLGILTRYDLGPFGLKGEMQIAKRFGTRIIVTGSPKQKGKTEEELRSEVKEFAENMKPFITLAKEANVVIAIENHQNSLINQPDSMYWLTEFCDSANLGIALAPYHLPQDTGMLCEIIKKLGPRLVHFYAWEHGMGCMEKLPKALEMQQMPGYGSLDFIPIVSALKKINYKGWTSIFMHPFPRGIPILSTADEVTAAINRSKEYLDYCIQKT